MTSGKELNDVDLWSTLEGLEDEILDPNYPDSLVEEELKQMGVDVSALDRRTAQLVDEKREERRLSWQTSAKMRKEQFARTISRDSSRELVTPSDRASLLARLDQIRSQDPAMESVFRLAASKRKPEESTDEELRMLLQEIELLRSLEDDDSE